jgi:cellulose synthase/poly-beta-1,6-N-acetylglucosamine synthase-like glycosyltransferase
MVLDEALICGTPFIATDFANAIEKKQYGIILKKDMSNLDINKILESKFNIDYKYPDYIKEWIKILKPIEKQNYKFSIIIPNYNNSKWLDKCINSILIQTYKNYEVIFIDDMSTDNSLKIAQELLCSFLGSGDNFIAEEYLDNYKLVNTSRNMYGYTGYYKGKRITIFPSGMGIPSMGIYSYELYKYYDVENIIRIGSCGGYNHTLKLKDIILVDNSYSQSTYAKYLDGYQDNLVKSTKNLNDIILKTSNELNLNEMIVLALESCLKL